MSRNYDDRRRDQAPRPEEDFLGRALPSRPAASADRVVPPPVAPASAAQPGGEVAPWLGRQAAVRLLSSRAAVREAILLTEIIGPPKALRPPQA